MTTASPLALAPDRPFAGLAAWYRSHQWLPVVVVLGLWAVMPGVRRLFDWKLGFASVSVLSIVPLLALIPAVVALIYRGQLRRVDRRLLACAWLWTGGFGVAFLVGAMTSGSPFAAAYSLVQFLLPMAFGLWVSTLNVATGELYDRVASAMLWLSTPLCLYAALQFVAPPPWDVAWMMNANIASIGRPSPYQLRPFSLLNSPGIFADFLDVAIALNLPRLLSSRSTLRIAQFALCIAALALTMVQTGWLGFAVGVVTYLVLVPHRARNLAVLGAVAGIGRSAAQRPRSWVALLPPTSSRRASRPFRIWMPITRISTASAISANCSPMRWRRRSGRDSGLPGLPLSWAPAARRRISTTASWPGSPRWDISACCATSAPCSR